MIKPLLIILKIFVFLFLPNATQAAELDVNPVRIFFTPGQSASSFSVTNLSNKVVNLKVSVSSWAQDEKGKSIYMPTSDLKISPKIFSILGKKKQVIRIASRIPAGTQEKTYRIYMKEIPDQENKKQPAQYERNSFFQIGIPIFVEPLIPEPIGSITNIQLMHSKLSFNVSNSGNNHFILLGIIIAGMDSTGETVYKYEYAGNYILEGSSYPLIAKIKKNICKQLNYISIQTITNTQNIKKVGLQTTPAMCREK